MNKRKGVGMICLCMWTDDCLAESSNHCQVTDTSTIPSVVVIDESNLGQILLITPQESTDTELRQAPCPTSSSKSLYL